MSGRTIFTKITLTTLRCRIHGFAKGLSMVTLILKILSDADEVQASYEQENNLGGDWGAAGTNDDDNNGWGNGW